MSKKNKTGNAVMIANIMQQLISYTEINNLKLVVSSISLNKGDGVIQLKFVRKNKNE